MCGRCCSTRRCRRALRAARRVAARGDAQHLDLESLGKLLEGLPLLHQEMLFLKLAGYTDASIERMLRMAPRVAQAAFARLETDYADALKIESDRCLWPRPWLALLQACARAQSRKPARSCTSFCAFTTDR